MDKNQIILFLSSLFMVFLWSVINPYEYFTWILETSPVIIGFAILAITYKKFTFTPLSYWLIWFGAVLVFVGAHYTYARMPLFDWIKVEFDLSRNHYDRFGHFFQGFVPAIIFRELILRTTTLKPGKWMLVIVISMCLAKSALYEFAEWIAAAILGQTAHEFLGTQGDEWDAQKDMAWALFGAFISLMMLRGWHTKQLKAAKYID